jgi:hypothetical protein
MTPTSTAGWLCSGSAAMIALPTTSAITTLTVYGDDRFQTGRAVAHRRCCCRGSVHDQTTRVGQGISFPTVVYGTGNTLHVYGNQAELRLEGNDGSDEFVVRAFALASNLTAQTTAAATEIGRRQRFHQYNVNAPWTWTAGGFDKLVILGTEFGDNFVITDHPSTARLEPGLRQWRPSGRWS